MKNVMILISGMPGTGKTTFAAWLSSEFRFPLVCYDNITKATAELAKNMYDDPSLYPPIVGAIPYNFLWFNIEEILKTSSPLIVEYFFNEMSRATIDKLTADYQYKVINVHFDVDAGIAYKRFMDRNEKDSNEKGIRPMELSLADFTEGVKDNKEFRYGDNIVYVDTSDFSNVSYEDIAKQVRKYMD